jgi:hypothetical protein
MEYLKCEYCGRKGTRVGFRGIPECTGCGAPSKSAPVSNSMMGLADAYRGLSEAIGGQFIGITCSGHYYPEEDKKLQERYGPYGNPTREGNRA